MIFGHQPTEGATQKEDRASGSPATGHFVVGDSTHHPVEHPAPDPLAGAPLPTLSDDDLDADDDTTQIIEPSQPSRQGSDDNSAYPEQTDTSPEPSAVKFSVPEPSAPTPVGTAPSHDLLEESPVATSDNPTPADEPITDESGESGDLLALKQQALNDLAPLVEHLNQTAEEHFRTIMMLLQSTDNHNLIKDAYSAAHAIDDEKVRAQALLDVVNEINYFTQQK